MSTSHSKSQDTRSYDSDLTRTKITIFDKTTKMILNNPVIFGGLGSPPPEKFSVPRSLNFKSE
jgi:hypothetical protein